MLTSINALVIFRPDYVTDPLSDTPGGYDSYDYRDCRAFDRVFGGVISNNHYNLRNDIDSGITELYTKTGDYVFTDDTVCVDDSVAFKAYKVRSPESDRHVKVIIVCGPGCMNILNKRNLRTVTQIRKWLVDYMFRELGDVAMHTPIFSTYWLSNKLNKRNSK